MATRVGPSTVSYGIGVQNRYSAFLDEDDGFNLPAVSLINPSAKSPPDNKKQAAQKLNVKGKTTNGGGHQKSTHQHSNGQKASNAKADTNKRQQQQKVSYQQQNNSSQQQQQHQPQMRSSSYSKPVGAQNEGPHNGGVPRFQHKNQQFNGSSTHQVNKENHDSANQQAAARPFYKGPRDIRFNNNNNNSRPRQAGRDDEKRTAGGLDGTPSNGTYGPSSEEEKRRRQQKRAIDLRYKDPERREARRNQSSSNSASDDQPQPSSEGQTEAEKNGRGFKVRREGERFENGVGRGAYKGSSRARGRRGFENGGEEGAPLVAERRNGGPSDGQTSGTGRRSDGERPQRGRGGYNRGAGPRFNGERGTRVEGTSRTVERQKPIPNFSDRSDFPSLAS